MAMILDLLALIFAVTGSVAVQDAFDPLEYVDPLIGSLNGGVLVYQSLLQD